MSEPFRCSSASASRDEPLVGTASTVRAFLLVEEPGPWGVDALRDSRLPEEVKGWLRGLRGVRPLLVRRQDRRRGATGVRVFAGRASARQPRLETAELSDVREVTGLDVEALREGRSPGLSRVAEPLYLVCTHGRHDACCAERGRPLCAALHVAARAQAWEVSHIGGDRFAANLLVLPDGLYYGRLGPEDAAPLVAAHRAGELDLDHLRGRCAYPFGVQAAEVHLRRHLGELGLATVRLRGHHQDGAVVRTWWDVAGTTWSVDVRATTVGAHRLTCRSLSARPAPMYELVSLDRRAA